MKLTDEDVRKILDLIDNSKFDFFSLEHEGLKLTVSKTPMAASPEAAPVVPPPEGEPAAPRPSMEIPEGQRAVPAPMVGTFYAGPKPGAPPFVTKGDAVTADATLGLIEVMKVFTAVTAGTAGVIEDVLVPDATGVEYGQPLFLITPEGE